MTDEIAAERRDETLLREIIGAFTRYPKTLRIKTERRSHTTTVISLWAHLSDQPKLVGSMGKHIQAIRTIFLYIGKREGRSISIFPNEPIHGMREALPPFEVDPELSPENAVRVMRLILDRILLRPYVIEPVSNSEQTMIQIAATSEEQPIVDGLKPYLHTLFHAIGKHEGATVYVESQQAVPGMK